MFGFDDLYAEMKTGNFMIFTLRVVTLVSYYFTNKKSKMAVAGPEGILYYQELHEIHVA